jgi:hypothetical protein
LAALGDAAAQFDAEDEISTIYYSTPSPQTSIAKALIVDLLRSLLEVSPTLSRLAGQAVLAVWPDFREA